MAWTYSGDPSTSDRDAVRFLIGDTDTNDQQFSDAEIDWLVSTHDSTYTAAIEAATSLAAKYARQVDRTVGDLRVLMSKRSEHYMALVKALQAQRNRVAMVAGISVGNDIDADPQFKLKQFDNPRT